MRTLSFRAPGSVCEAYGNCDLRGAKVLEVQRSLAKLPDSAAPAASAVGDQPNLSAVLLEAVYYRPLLDLRPVVRSLRVQFADCLLHRNAPGTRCINLLDLTRREQLVKNRVSDLGIAHSVAIVDPARIIVSFRGASLSGSNRVVLHISQFSNGPLSRVNANPGRRVEAASSLSAVLVDTPCLRAMDEATDLKPGCFFDIEMSCVGWPTFVQAGFGGRLVVIIIPNCGG
jgi:hypothetical protein